MSADPIPCPSWCTEPAGHEFDSVGAGGPFRYHDRAVGEVARVAVCISAGETLSDGRPVPADLPHITVGDNSSGMTADDAEQLAHVLLDAAVQMRAIAVPRRPHAVVNAWECAPVGLDGHRWPCPRAERRSASCTGQGCGL